MHDGDDDDVCDDVRVCGLASYLCHCLFCFCCFCCFSFFFLSFFLFFSDFFFLGKFVWKFFFVMSVRHRHHGHHRERSFTCLADWLVDLLID